MAADLPEQRLPGGRIVVDAPSSGTYHLTVRLLGLVPVRQVTVAAVPALAVVPGGQAIGVVLDSRGVLVVQDASGPSDARQAGLRAGDLIVVADGQAVRSMEHLAALVQRAGRAGRSLRLTVQGAGGRRQVSVRPAWDPGAHRYLIGAWVRDGADGIGTLTFFDPARAVFAALGHVVNAGPGSAPYPVRHGRIVPAVVSGLARGRDGDPGEKIGVLPPGSAPWGIISSNTHLGVYGRLLARPAGGLFDRPLPVALEDQIRSGPARMLTVISGTRVQSFAVEILRVIAQGRPESKGLILRVTDPRLLRRTGGIVQGMSGSPLLEDGRLIGAVTHVFVNDPTRGYGILAVWMAEGAGLWHP